MVYLIDDDPAIRSSLAWAMESSEVEFCAYAEPTEFFNNYVRDRPACLLLDLELEGVSGLSVLEELRTKRFELPVIVVTGTGDVARAVQSMKLRAVDFFEKPVQPATLVAACRQALQTDAARLAEQQEKLDAARRFVALTRRERDLVPLICSGMTNRQMAMTLHISVKTIKNHRASLMQKVGAANAADLAQLATTCSLVALRRRGV